MDDIQRNTKLAVVGENEFLEHVTKLNKDKQKLKITKSTKELSKCNKRIGELDLIIKRLYEDNVLGKISDERFMIMTKDYENEQRELKKSVEEYQDQMQEVEEKCENTLKFIELIKKYTDIAELTAPMLKELIDHIVIHQSDKSSRKRCQRVDIHYRFIGSI